ncbi:MAG TPA: acyl carrier protein [Bacteroidales bacterium]|nr:acyl carrier protein [Bacteroidales bacterium]
MDKQTVRQELIALISNKLKVFGIAEGEVGDGFDLVRSGLLDSMAFIDLVASLEEKFKVEIDFEKAAEEDSFTTFGGLITFFTATSNAG